MSALHDALQAIDGLREVSDADSDALIALIGGIWSTYPGVILDVDNEEPWLLAPRTYYAEHGGRMWVVGDPVTASVAGRCGPEGSLELKSMYVHAGHRRQGVGQRLVRVVEAYGDEQGVDRITLWSDTKFLEAHAFYEALGYERTGRARELGDISGTTEYEFCKRLSPG